MLTERERAERRRVVATLAACVVALAIAVTATSGMAGDELRPSVGPQLSSFGN